MTPRVCIVTAGHLSTSPRMLKAADALAGAGYRVRVVSARNTDWATEADLDVRSRRPKAWDWSVVDYRRSSARRNYLRTGVRFRSSRLLVTLIGSARCPERLVEVACSRAHSELLDAALAEPADFFYGGTTGGLAVVTAAARRSQVPYALDLEDFHSAELEDSTSAHLDHTLIARIEGSALTSAAFLTAAGAAIATAYTNKYGVWPIPINNTFSLPLEPPDPAPSPGEGLRLYWFSQTVGPRRGLEDAVHAMGLAGIPGEFHIRGRAIPGYLESLERLGAHVAPRLKIVHHEPAPPDMMVDLCGAYDVGLSLEQGHVLNRALCLTNKAFTYILGSVAVAFTDTPGQRALASDLADGAIMYRPGDVRALAEGLGRWAADKAALGRAKAAAWAAARRRWHWEHPAERGSLLDAVARVLGR